MMMPAEARYAEVKALLERHGWTHRRTSGAHHIFKKPGDRLFSIPVHGGKVKWKYVYEIKKHIGEE